MSDAAVHNQDVDAMEINTALGELAGTMGQDCPENDYPWLVFLLGNTQYAINARYVTRIAVLYELVPFADAPAYCPGVIWDRDGMIRLLDLRALFGEGNYLSAIDNVKNRLPLLLVIGLDGKRRGMIVDRIIAMGYSDALTEPFADQESALAGYVQGTVKYDQLKAPALVVSPDSFSSLEFENPNAKISWNERTDIILKIQNSLQAL